MVALGRNRSIAFLLFVLVAIMGLAIFGYFTIRGLPGSKVAAERFLMVSALVSLLTAVIGLVLYRKSQDLDRTLRRALERVSQSSFSVRGYFASARLGELGNILAEIFFQVEELSEKKSLRIGALNALTQTLLNRLTDRVVITNGAGEIFQWSKSVPRSEGDESGTSALAGKTIDTFLKGLDIDVMVNHFYREETPYRFVAESGKSTAYPVFDARRNLTYCICILGSDATLTIPEAQSSRTSGENTEAHSVGPLAGVFGRVKAGTRRFLGRK